MQNFNFLEKELLDIIFKGRNQQYGAYTLRKFYPERIRNAMFLTGLILLSLVGIYFAADIKVGPGITPPQVLPDPIIKIKRVVMPLKNEGKAGQMKKTEPKPNKRNPYEIVDNTTTVVPPITKVEKLTPPVIHTGDGSNTNPMAPEGLGGTKTEGMGLPNEGGTMGKVVKTTAPTAPYETVQFMPEFPGGEDALLRFLQKNIKYPKMASSVGIAGTVYVEFVVNASGKITNVHVLKGIGAGCDREAMRVIKSMPAWKPGIQDGQKVPVMYRIPVEFQL